MRPLLALANVEEDKPKRKRGRPTKEEAAKRKAEEEQGAKQELGPTPPKPAVQFIEVDGGDKGRFFSAEMKGKDLVIAYNTRHPLVRLVAEAGQPKVHAVLDMMAFALAKAEGDVPEGKKLVNRACDYLAVLAAPRQVVTGGRGPTPCPLPFQVIRPGPGNTSGAFLFFEFAHSGIRVVD
jgi:hypothetical protein